MLIATVLAFFVILIAVGAWYAGRIQSASDFLVAGRSVGLLLTITTLAAMQIGAGVILGGSATAAQHGIWPGMYYGLGCGGGLIIGGLLAAERMREHAGFVPLDFFGHRFGEKRLVRTWAWLSNIPSLLGIFVAQIMAAGAVLSVFGFPYRTGVVVVAVVVALYSALGGMFSVVAVDFIQLIITFIGIPAVAIAAALKLGSAGAVHTLLATPLVPTGLGTKAVFLILPFLLSISVSYDAYMRYQAARTARIAKWGCILGGVVVMIVAFFASFAGAAGHQLFPALPADGSIFPQTVRILMPSAVTGLVVAGLLAATMSAANCLLISLSGTFTRDFYNQVLHPDQQLNDLPHARLLSRLVIVGALLVAILIAFKAKSLLDTIILFNYPYMGSMLVPMLGGILWKRATSLGAFAALITGGGVAVLALVLGAFCAHGEHFRDLGLFAAYGASALVFITVSLLTQPSPASEA